MLISLITRRKLFLGALRVHHGLTGAAVFTVGCAANSRLLRGAGVVLMLDDVFDYPWSCRDA